MARSFNNVKAVSALVNNAIKGTTNRAYSASAAAAPAPQGVVSNVAKASAKMVKKIGDYTTTEKVSWVPDPRTGFYRPENMADEIDVAELRASLLKKH